MLKVERAGWSGLVRVTIDGPQGRTVDEFHNLITDAGLNLLRDVLEGAKADGMIRYIAVGSDPTPPAAGQTQLGAEFFRKAVATEPGGVGQTVSSVFLQAEEAVGDIRELGWFAGPEAGAQAGSGVMIARVLYTHPKTNLETVYIDRTDTIGRAV